MSSLCQKQQKIKVQLSGPMRSCMALPHLLCVQVVFCITELLLMHLVSLDFMSTPGSFSPQDLCSCCSVFWEHTASYLQETDPDPWP